MFGLLEVLLIIASIVVLTLSFLAWRLAVPLSSFEEGYAKRGEHDYRP